MTTVTTTTLHHHQPPSVVISGDVWWLISRFAIHPKTLRLVCHTLRALSTDLVFLPRLPLELMKKCLAYCGIQLYTALELITEHEKKNIRVPTEDKATIDSLVIRGLLPPSAQLGVVAVSLLVGVSVLLIWVNVTTSSF